MSTAIVTPSEEEVLNELELTTTSTTTLEPSPKYSPPVLSTPGSVDIELLNKQLTKIQTSITDGTAQIMAKLSSMNMKGGAFNPNTDSRMKGGDLFGGIFGTTTTMGRQNAVTSPVNSKVLPVRPKVQASNSPPKENQGGFLGMLKKFDEGGISGVTGNPPARKSLPPPSGKLLPTVPTAPAAGGYRRKSMRRSTRKSRRSGKKSRRSSSK